MKQIEFNKIYFDLDADGYINLLFTCNKNETCLYFDGINFYFKEKIRVDKILTLFDYNKNADNLKINKITQDFDMFFIQISNGDIFQISSMIIDENLSQVIAIFDREAKKTFTPLGISTYEAAVKRAEQGNEAEVL